MEKNKRGERRRRTSASRLAHEVAVFVAAVALMSGTKGHDATPPDQNSTSDRATPAQTELIQGINERRYEADIEKADSEHQAEMKKCEGLVWEEEKLCKDQVSKETAQTQAEAEKKREKIPTEQ